MRYPNRLLFFVFMECGRVTERSSPKPNAGTVPTTSSPKRQWKTANARATSESVERTKLDFSQSLFQEPLFRSVGGQRECAQMGLLRLTSSACASIETCPGCMRRFVATEIVDQHLGQSQPPTSKRIGHRSTHRLAVSPRTHLVCARICLNHRDGARVQVIHGAHDLECTSIHQRTQHLTLL